MKYTSLMGTTMLALSMGLSGGVAADTLRDALAAAYVSNPDLEAARAGQRALDEGVSSATANYLPQLSAQGFYGENRQDRGGIDTDPGNVASGTSKSATASFSQPLFAGFRNKNARSGAKADVYAGRAQLVSTEQSVLLSAVTAYMDVYRDVAVLELNENNVQVLQRQLEASQDRFRVGEITRTDVAQSEARLAGAVSARISSEATLAASRATYERVVGSTPGTLDPVPDLPPLPTSIDAAIEVGRDANPTVIAAKFNEESSRYAVKQAKGGVLPSVDGVAQYRYSSSPTAQIGTAATFESQSYSAGIQVTVPLYQGGAEYAAVRRAKQINSQRRLEILSAERQVMEQVRTAFEQYRASVSSIDSTQSQVRANEIALDGVRQEAAVGSRTTLDVLDAEQELLDSRVNLVRAERNEYVAGFALLSAIGRLNAVSLDLPVSIYDPSDYYSSIRWKVVGWGVKE